jgi:hypothetical protein
MPAYEARQRTLECCFPSLPPRAGTVVLPSPVYRQSMVHSGDLHLELRILRFIRIWVRCRWQHHSINVAPLAPSRSKMATYLQMIAQFLSFTYFAASLVRTSIRH